MLNVDETILITEFNDFIFCPVSIYFHKLYGNRDTITYQNVTQINGTNAHKNVDENTYSHKKNILTAMDVYFRFMHSILHLKRWDMLYEKLNYIAWMIIRHIILLYQNVMQVCYKNLKMDSFIQNNLKKCKHCIYEPACDRCLTEEL